jgi:hypothetical protein
LAIDTLLIFITSGRKQLRKRGSDSNYRSVGPCI